MNKVYINSLQNIINNESCNTTYTPNLGEYSLTSTYGENIKIYYESGKAGLSMQSIINN